MDLSTINMFIREKENIALSSIFNGSGASRFSTIGYGLVITTGDSPEPPIV